MVPGEVVSVTQTVGEDLDVGVLATRVEAPELGGERVFARLVVIGRLARLAAIGARAAADVKQAIGSLGDMVHAMVIGAYAEVISRPEPRLWFRPGTGATPGLRAEDRHLVHDGRLRLVALVADEVESAFVIRAEAETGRVAELEVLELFAGPQ